MAEHNKTSSHSGAREGHERVLVECGDWLTAASVASHVRSHSLAAAARVRRAQSLGVLRRCARRAVLTTTEMGVCHRMPAAARCQP